MIKRLNAGILNFIKGIRLRSSGATILGAFAGLSLTSNIIPSAMSFMGVMDSFSARWGLGGYAVYSMMIWAVGGWATQRIGNKGFGAVTLGFVGLTSGLVFTAMGIGMEMNALLVGGGAAMLYGAVGGMIIADALRDPVESAANGTADKRGSEKKGAAPNGSHTARAHKTDARWFRFFK